MDSYLALLSSDARFAYCAIIGYTGLSPVGLRLGFHCFAFSRWLPDQQRSVGLFVATEWLLWGLEGLAVAQQRDGLKRPSDTAEPSRHKQEIFYVQRF
jgi:hypothetical protein